MLFKTVSGTVYELTNELGYVRRIPDREDPGYGELRKDFEWVQLLTPPEIVLGQRVRLVLAPLGEGDCTVRTTTPVVAIHRNVFYGWELENG